MTDPNSIRQPWQANRALSTMVTETTTWAPPRTEKPVELTDQLIAPPQPAPNHSTPVAWTVQGSSGPHGPTRAAVAAPTTRTASPTSRTPRQRRRRSGSGSGANVAQFESSGSSGSERGIG